MKSLKEGLCPLSRIVLSFYLSMLPAVALASGDSGTPASGATLNAILFQAHKSVGEFWQQFRSVTCIERVAQERLGKKGEIDYVRKSTFDYLVFMSADQDDFSIEESRLLQGKESKAKNVPLLITSGIPTLLLVFHPYYEEDFNYHLEGEEMAGGRKLNRIRFEHIPGRRSTSALRLRGKDYPLEIQGVASIDPETGAIEKIVAGLSAPMRDVNLKALEMDVRYDPQAFGSAGDVYWLPSTATINIRSELQHWRNIHQYSNYKRFSVKTENKISK
jgi:hypothetical protein